VVARFSGFHDAVAAADGVGALERAARHPGRLALLAAGRVDDPVAAEKAGLDLARRRATIAVVGVAVVALLGAAAGAVAAAALDPAVGAAAVAVDRVAVVAPLARLDPTVAALGPERRQLDLHELAAPRVVRSRRLVGGARPDVVVGIELDLA